MNEIFKALADPSRRKIIRILKKGPMNVGQILEHFEMSGASLNHHLNILKNAGLIDGDKKGQFIIYTLNATILQEVLEWILEIKETNRKKPEQPPRKPRPQSGQNKPQKAPRAQTPKNPKRKRPIKPEGDKNEN